jgi:hypothetical protein
MQMGATQTPRGLSISWSEGWKGGAPADGETIGTGPRAEYKLIASGGLYAAHRRANGTKEWEELLPLQRSVRRAHKACVEDNKTGIF